MPSLLTPPRRYDPEFLDDPSVDERVLLASVADIARSNTLFRGTRAVLAELAAVLPTLPRHATLLDVGTGAGDIPPAAAREAADDGISLDTIGLDTELALVRDARTRLSHAVCGDACNLPFASRSIDVVICSQVLHHFRDEGARGLLREANRVARHAVIVSDLRRSWIAAAGFWAASFPLHFHPVTRHDGVVSVMRGFTTAELSDTVHDALRIRPPIRSRLGFRVTTHWTPV